MFERRIAEETGIAPVAPNAEEWLRFAHDSTHDSGIRTTDFMEASL